MARRWRRWSSHIRAFLPAAVAVAVGLVAVLSQPTEDIDVWLPDLAAGLTLAIAGGVITIVEPRSPLGLIVEMAALAWFLADFRTSDVPPLAAFATTMILLHRAVLFHAIVAFPTGRIASFTERLIVVAAYASVLALPTPSELAAIGWSITTLIVFVALVRARSGPARDAGLQALPTMALLALVIGGTNLLFLLVGNAPAPQTIVNAYNVGIGAVGVVLTVTVVRYRSRLGRLTAAAVELTHGQAGYVRELLADALRDPTVEVAFAVEGTAGTTWVDELGRPIDALRASGSRTVIPIRIDGRTVAELACEADVAEEPALRGSIETAARLAARNARLRAGLRDEANELQASRLRLLSAADEQRIALSQQLERGASASVRDLGPLLDAIPVGAHPTVRGAVDRTRARSEALIAELRSLAAGLGPADLRATGLEGALSRLGGGFDGRLDLTVDAPDLPDGLAAAAYFISAEGIANATKHAMATEIAVTIQRRGDRLLISVADDGIGGAIIEAGSGLSGVADRASALGGAFSIDSPGGAGTRLSVDLPLR